MRILAAVGCVLLLVSPCWCAGETRGRDLAIRGMKMVAREGATEREQARGWDLVAEGVGVLLSLPGKWEEDEGTLASDVQWFLGRCAWAGGVPQSPDPPSGLDEGEMDEWFRVHGGYEIRLDRIHDRSCASRDRFAPCEALLIRLTYCPWPGPSLDGCFLLIGRIGGRTVTSAWRQDIGRRTPVRLGGSGDHRRDWDGSFDVCDWAAWEAGGELRAVFAGGWNQGQSGGPSPPMAVLVESAGTKWRVIDTIGPPHERGGWHEYNQKDEHGVYGLDDVNGDGLPEVVGNSRSPSAVVGCKYAPKHYVVHRLIGRRYAKVWYSKAATPEAVLERLERALLLGSNEMLANISASRQVAEQAKLIPIPEDGRLMGDLQIGSGPVGKRASYNDGGAQYHIDLVELARWRWQISGIERVEAEQEGGKE